MELLSLLFILNQFDFYSLFQEQLDMTNTSASVGMQRINEVKNEVTKLAEEVNRIDYTVTTQARLSWHIRLAHKTYLDGNTLKGISQLLRSGGKIRVTLKVEGQKPENQGKYK